MKNKWGKVQAIFGNEASLSKVDFYIDPKRALAALNF